MLRKKNREPDFNNLKLVLERKPTTRPVLFDFIIGDDKTRMLTGKEYCNDTEFDCVVSTIKAFDSAGYDYSPIIVRGLTFTKSDSSIQKETKSLNSGALITDRDSYNLYQWPDINNCDFSIIKKAGKYLHPNVKFVPFSFDGILENTVGIVGYENLCYLLFDDIDLLGDIFNQVGKRLFEYYKALLDFDEVGAILCNDDWGFNTQTMIPPDALRKFVFPWYKKIVELAHKKNKYAILHSCGYFEDIIDDVIDDMKFDGRHSYEDKIMPVEKAYDLLYPRIAVLGGMDIDFLARKSPEEIYSRSKDMLVKTQKTGGYALGSGNSIPDYISNENCLALLKAALEGYGERSYYEKK
ncbi:MAG: hypothetical protein JEZ05_00645 [Tenericutes bacterium]|nr:hypothetical protein [Mycoplasmatota bacterium]